MNSGYKVRTNGPTGTTDSIVVFDTLYRIACDYEISLHGWANEDTMFISGCVIVDLT